MSDILILGDSTSMTIGLENESYPFKLAQKSTWKPFTRFINCSQPGFTSADACAFFFNHYNKYSNIVAVIINLGTCDSFSSEIKKGKYTLRKQLFFKIKQILGLKVKHTKLTNSLLHFEWNNYLDLSIESPESPEDYEFNLMRIVKKCKTEKIQVVLISPFSHKNFPSGVGKGNFVFYRYLNVKEKLSNKLIISDERLIKALNFHEKGQYKEALDSYRYILLNTEEKNLAPEYQLLVTNNYAVCAAEAGQLYEAEYLFDLLLKEDQARKEIILYNLAGIKKIKSDYKSYEKLILDSYQCDSSMYRIRDPYLQSLKNISKKYGPSLKLINEKDFIEDTMFIDHCHPLPEGQDLIADKILDSIDISEIKGRNKAEIKNELYNPELAMGNSTEFYSYYKAFCTLSEKQIKETITSLNIHYLKQDKKYYEFIDEEIKRMQFPKEVLLAIKHHLSHPCFSSIESLLVNGIKYPSDIGRFPELFIIRFIIPYIKILENTPSLNHIFAKEKQLLRSSEQLKNVLPEQVKSFVSDKIINLNKESAEIWVVQILEKIKNSLMAHIKKGNQINERLKTTIYWFFRETLRFGTHSRISMRYDRVFLEYTAESLAVASVLNFNANLDKSDQIAHFISILENITTIHDKYCSNFNAESNNSDLLNLYDEELFGIQSEIGRL